MVALISNLSTSELVKLRNKWTTLSAPPLTYESAADIKSNLYEIINDSSSPHTHHFLVRPNYSYSLSLDVTNVEQQRERDIVITNMEVHHTRDARDCVYSGDCEKTSGWAL